MNAEQFSVRTARTKLLIQKHSPEILLVGGITSVVAGTVLACRATLNTPAILGEARAMMAALDIIAEEDGQETGEVKKAKVLVTVEAGVGLARVYAPSVVLMVAGIGMLVGSNRILNGRNAAILGAYKAVDEAYKRYRGRVREELGDDVDNYFRFKKRRKDGTMQVLDDKKKKIKFDEIDNIDLPGELIDAGDMGIPSPYAVFFDNDSPQWRGSGNSYNEFFLKAQQNHANDRLALVGHVFLNEVYDMLGVDRTKEGAVVGWVKDHGDSFVDFDLYNPYNALNGEFEREKQESFLLDFNVDGVIYDLI